MDNVVDLGVVSPLDHDPDYLLQRAIGQLDEVVILGYTKDGQEYFKSSKADGGSVLWHLEIARTNLMKLDKPAPND